MLYNKTQQNISTKLQYIGNIYNIKNRHLKYVIQQDTKNISTKLQYIGTSVNYFHINILQFRPIKLWNEKTTVRLNFS